MRLQPVYALSALLVLAACDEQPSLVESAAPSSSIQASAVGAPVVLRGTIIAPSGVLKHGYVGIVNGRIVWVSTKPPDLPGALVVNTDGIVIPGFVDLHHHVPWNALLRWHPPHLYANRYEWRVDPDYFAPPDSRSTTSWSLTSAR